MANKWSLVLASVWGAPAMRNCGASQEEGIRKDLL